MSDISKLSSSGLARALNSSDVTAKEADAKVKEVADLYEQYFMKEMMRNMRSTVQEGGLLKTNNAEKIFREQLDDQYSVEANKRGGFGISDLIYQQLTQKFGVSQPGGPFPADKKMKIQELAATSQQSTYLLHPENVSNEKNVNVNSPWAGVLHSKNRLEGDKTSYAIKHDNGLESLILTQGGPSAETRHLSPGDKLEAGQTLGLANTSSPLVWTVKSSVSE